MKEINVGDWVTSYSAGIWQVYRVIDDFYEFRWNLKEKKEKSNRTLVFSKRLFNSKWKRSLSTEACEITFIDLLGKEDKAKVIKLLSSDEKLKKAFNDYKPKAVNLLSGYSFSLPGSYPYNKFKSRITELFEKSIASGLTMDEINKILIKSELEEFKERTPNNARIQLICKDHELVNGEFIFREVQTFEF